MNEQLQRERDEARADLESLHYMIKAVHRLCDEAGVPKPPEGEPGIPWRVLRLLEERAKAAAELTALRERVGELEQSEQAVKSIREACLELGRSPTVSPTQKSVCLVVMDILNAFIPKPTPTPGA